MKERAAKFGDIVTGDFLTAQADDFRGGLRDFGSGEKMCYHTRTRETDDCVLALEKFLGPNTKPSLFYSDKEGGLVAACRRLAFQHRLSQPASRSPTHWSSARIRTYL